MIANLFLGFLIPTLAYASVKTVLIYAIPSTSRFSFLRHLDLDQKPYLSGLFISLIILIEGAMLCIFFKRIRNSMPCIRFTGKAFSFTLIALTIGLFNNVTDMIFDRSVTFKNIFIYIITEITPLLVISLFLAKLYTPVARSTK